MVNTSNLLRVAISTAKKAGNLLNRNFGKVKSIEYKEGEIKNVVTDLDKKSEDLIIKEIKKYFPQHNILSEEIGELKTNSDYLWVIDPLDGTVNYSHNVPLYSVSIGILHKKEIIAGVIYNPTSKELFCAEKNKGAFLNGKKISVSKVNKVEKSCLVTGFPYNVKYNPSNVFEHFILFLKKSQAVRRLGSAALDLAYLAAGRFDGYWEVNLKPWDKAAGILLVNEAGGRVTDFKNIPLKLNEPNLLASNNFIHNEMLEILRMN